LTGSPAGLRLNVGCGPDAPLNWINIDRSPHILLDRFPPLKRSLHRAGILADAHMTVWPPGILFHDIRKPLPYAGGSAEAIYSAHMLEHLYFDEANNALVELRRLLSPVGVLRLALPDSELLASVFLRDSAARGADAALEFNAGLNAHPLSRAPARRRLSDRLGASIHRWQPTRALVTKMLLDAGFGGVAECTFLCGDLPDLATVEHRPESFFLEARVPGSGGIAHGTTDRAH